MQIDPMQNWRSLADNYAQMSDGELLALAEDFRDLTDTARQVLRDEMRKRNLGDPQSSAATPSGADAQWNPSALSAAGANAGGDDTSPDVFVWKNLLCECNDREEAWQISEVLRHAGIESWIDSSWRYDRPESEFTPRLRPRVLVASDRLEDARALLAQPIPQQIIEETKAAYTGYVPPVCPRCGAPDPVLESNDPANTWKCDVCGKEWTEAAPVAE
jgi:hypothetical protein